jgi:hypothetical protein
MRQVLEQYDATPLPDRLHDATVANATLVRDVIGNARRHYPHPGQAGKIARIERLIKAEAWAEVALALIDLELPQWQLRRITYDGGEWHCALSCQRELPDWLDQSIEASHPNLPLAMLNASLEAQQIAPASGRPSVPAMARKRSPPYTVLCCDNFA